MRWYDRIIAAHREVTDAVSHYEHIESARYFVWQEDGANDLPGDDKHAERAVSGSTDLYTKQEFDPWCKGIEQAFDKYGIAWSWNSVQYEESTGFVHYSWDWEVLDG